MKLSVLTLAVTGALSFGTLAHDIGIDHQHKDSGYQTPAGFVSTVDPKARMWDATNKTAEQITSRIQTLVELSDPRTMEERAADEAVKARYKDALVIDTLHVTSEGFAGGKGIFAQTLQESIDGNFTLESVTATNGDPKLVKGGAIGSAKMSSEALKGNEDIMLVNSVADIHTAKESGKLGVVYNIQGSLEIQTDKMDETVRGMREAGILQANIAYNTNNHFGGGVNENDKPVDQRLGLTKAGIELIKTYNKYGVVVDCSHSSDAVCSDIAKYSTKPVMASHSNARGLMDIARNLSDEAIIAIAKSGGTISPNFLGGFLNIRGDASSEAIAEHVVYIADLITKELGINGKKHVGFGADYTHTYGDALQVIVRNPEKYKVHQGYGSITEQAYASDVWGVVRVLEEKYNWSEEDVKGFLGENVLRVYAANWK